MKNPDEVLTIKLTRKQVGRLVSILDYYGLTEQNRDAIYLSQKIRDDIQLYRPDVNHCVCCGAIIPEGRQVCPNCERTLTDAPLILKPVDTLRNEKN